MDLLLELTEEALRQDRPAQAEAYWPRLQELRDAAGGALTQLQRGRLVEIDGVRSIDDPLATEQAWHDACQWYAAAGDQVRQMRIIGRLALHRCHHGGNGESLAQLQESAEYLLAHGSAKDQAGALRRLAVGLLHSGRPAEAVQVIGKLTGVAEPDPGVRVRLQQQLVLAQALGADGQVDAAVQVAKEVVAEATKAGEPELLGMGEFFLGQGLTMRSDGAGAAAAYQRALQHTDLPQELVQEVRERRGLLLAGTGQAAEVVDDLAGLVERLIAEEQADEVNYARFQLAVAMFNAGRANDAAEVAEAALAGADEEGNLALGDQIRRLLAMVYLRLDELDHATEYLDQLAAHLNGFDQAAERGKALEQAGELLFDLDRDGAAGERLAAAAQSYGLADLPLAKIRALRRQAVAQMFAQQPAAAQAALAEAEDAMEVVLRQGTAADEDERCYEAAWLAVDAARVLAGTEDPELALMRIIVAPAAFRDLGAFGEAFLAELTMGEVLLVLGRPGEAEVVLRSVVQGLPRDAGALPGAAFALAHALVELGKQAEAEDLATTYGFDLD